MSLLGCLLTAIMASAVITDTEANQRISHCVDVAHNGDWQALKQLAPMARLAAPGRREAGQRLLCRPKLAMFPEPAHDDFPAGRWPEVVKATTKAYEMDPLDRTA